ncbi:helicase associated domain-containing protein [Streptomyces sp. NPDC002205]|uniref:helicase associated domain-containing protein n=1 Tax=Streptomyces sp. NPDC002205 TaxID=3154411 RepID=UPI0033298C5B
MEAAQQFHAREGHLNVPGKHLDHLDENEAGVKLGMFVDNSRRRADKLTPRTAQGAVRTRHALGLAVPHSQRCDDPVG